MPAERQPSLHPTSSQKTALVTGATKRIGRAIALRLADEGWNIALHARSDDEAASNVQREIASRGGRSALIVADLLDDSAVQSLVTTAAEQLGPISCLINNASLFEQDTIGHITTSSWDAHLDVNLKAPVFLAKALAEQLPSETSGNIVNIIDQRVWRLTPDFFSYTISKSALWTATRTLALAFAPRIRVNAIGPGPVLQSIHQTEADFAEEERSVPMGRGAAPEEIADGVVVILSTPSMTGQMIALDGGQHLV